MKHKERVMNKNFDHHRPARADQNNQMATRPQRFVMSRVLILDPKLARDLIVDRRTKGIDNHDEVWEGIYVMPPMASNPHQQLVGSLCFILREVIGSTRLGQVLPGANVSDRRENWESNYRCPDVVVAFTNSRAVDCTTHWLGGPDFLVEIESPGDETDQKIPFYSRIRVQELLMIHRDSRRLLLYRHDGRQLVSVDPSPMHGGKWLVSEVVPLAFRRKTPKAGPRTEVRRTDGKSGTWMV
jgi:Uma2 family endonuclease